MATRGFWESGEGAKCVREQGIGTRESGIMRKFFRESGDKVMSGYTINQVSTFNYNDPK